MFAYRPVWECECAVHSGNGYRVSVTMVMVSSAAAGMLQSAFMVWWFTIATINIHTANAHIICDLCSPSHISWSHTCKFMQLLILRVPACRFNIFLSPFLCCCHCYSRCCHVVTLVVMDVTNGVPMGVAKWPTGQATRSTNNWLQERWIGVSLLDKFVFKNVEFFYRMFIYGFGSWWLDFVVNRGTQTFAPQQFWSANIG